MILDSGSNPDSGLEWAVYERTTTTGKRERVLAFGGTDDWWKELPQSVDQALFGVTDGQYAEADGIAKDVSEKASKDGLPLTITGHSLGGGLAQYVALQINSRNTQAVVFNSAPIDFSTSLAESLRQRLRGQSAEDLITNVQVIGDPVSQPITWLAYTLTMGSAKQYGKSVFLQSRNLEYTSDILKGTFDTIESDLMSELRTTAEIANALRDEAGQEMARELNLVADSIAILEQSKEGLDPLRPRDWWELLPTNEAIMFKKSEALGIRANYLGKIATIAAIKGFDGTKLVSKAAIDAVKVIIGETLKAVLRFHEMEFVLSGLTRDIYVGSVFRTDNRIEDDKRDLVLVSSGILDLARRRAFNAVDVLFLADNTASMGGIINSVKTHALDILNKLAGDDSRFTDVEINWGVARYVGDPTEGVSPSTAYEMIQTITATPSVVETALGEWNASGGGDAPEAVFFAIQQAATDGAGIPRDGSKATSQTVGWRNGAAKVIVVFGDQPSHQSTVNEQELRQVLSDNSVAVSFIDTSSLNSGSNLDSWDATSGTQQHGAIEELADGSRGAYIALTDVDEVTEAVMDAVFDAIADNVRTGGQLTRIDGTKIWRSRAR